MYKEAKYLSAGDQALVIEYGNEINEEVNSRVRAMMMAIEQGNVEGIVEMVPTYRSLMVHYNPLVIGYEELIDKLRILEGSINSLELRYPEVIEIPTLYGGEYGPDIEFVASHNNLTEEEVINIHSAKEYLIYMLGFTPGFPYLGGMDEKIAAPRLKTPRTKIAGGSVGIAASQTGIYPIDSPGGWQLIGKTPLRLYDANRKRPILLKAGNYIKFVPINQEKYQEIEQQIKAGSFEYISYPIQGRK
jgi:inhibitor of KinA